MIHPHPTGSAPRTGHVCNVKTDKKAAEEEKDYEYEIISPGYYTCSHKDQTYIIAELTHTVACSCEAMKFRKNPLDVCKHIVAFDKLKELPTKPVSPELEQSLKAAGWIGKKLHPPDPPKKKLPPVHDPARKPTRQAATRAERHKRHEAMTAEEIVADMNIAELERNARKGGVAAIAELNRRKAAEASA